jgi:hypothetical protein
MASTTDTVSSIDSALGDIRSPYFLTFARTINTQSENVIDRIHLLCLGSQQNRERKTNQRR